MICLISREKGRILVRYVELCTIKTQINEFLLQLCTKLNCCLSLVATNESFPSGDRCISIDCQNCSQLISSNE
jgi:hypothetical protein